MADPEPKIRGDALGRVITEARLKALEAYRYKPGQSGNPGGSYKKNPSLSARLCNFKHLHAALRAMTLLIATVSCGADVPQVS